MSTNFRSEEEVRVTSAERKEHSLHWKPVMAGAISTLGIQVFFFYLGSALGLSSFSADRAETFSDSALWGPVLFILVTAAASAFVGGWITGLFGNYFTKEDVALNSGLTWALSAVLIALGLSTLAGLTSSATQSGALKAQVSAATPGQEKAAQQVGSVAYDRLNDPTFAGFVAERARAFASKQETPMNVSVDSKSNAPKTDHRSVKPKNIESDYELQRFVMTATDMNKDSTAEFLKQERESIAQAAADSQRRWEVQHARDIAKAETARKSASGLAWAMTLAGLVSLAMTIVGGTIGSGRELKDLADKNKA
jgi:hypothetical protein